LAHRPSQRTAGAPTTAVSPFAEALEASGDIIVVDPDAEVNGSNGQVFRWKRATGELVPLSGCRRFNNPVRAVVEGGGDILVVDSDAASSGAVFRIDAATGGCVTLLHGTSGETHGVIEPFGIALAADGTIVLADEDANPADLATGTGAIFAYSFATNAITRVIPPEWMTPGVHATCVKISELGDATFRKADRIVIHAKNFAPENYIAGYGDEKVWCHDPVDFIRGEKKSASDQEAAPYWIDSPELKDVIGGKVAGRTSDKEVTCFINNIGLGIQFAAVGNAVYLAAKEKGIGKEIPTDWFLETVHP
jgi:hypothetical protein